MRPTYRLAAPVLIAVALTGCAIAQEKRAAAAEPALKLEIKEARDERNERSYIEAIFTNGSEEKLAIYPPQDGSYYGWLPPSYAFEIKKRGEKELIALLPRCGNHGGSYDSTRIWIAPGKAATVKLYPPHPLVAGESYEMRLTYEVEARKYPGPSVYFPSTETVVYKAWPAGIFVGRVSSKWITVTW